MENIVVELVLFCDKMYEHFLPSCRAPRIPRQCEHRLLFIGCKLNSCWRMSRTYGYAQNTSPDTDVVHWGGFFLCRWLETSKIWLNSKWLHLFLPPYIHVIKFQILFLSFHSLCCIVARLKRLNFFFIMLVIFCSKISYYSFAKISLNLNKRKREENKILV